MTIRITLTAGVDTGPLFNIFSNVDGYASPVLVNVPKSSMTGATNLTVPNGTTSIRILSNGPVCNNDIYLEIDGTTTTSTSTTSTSTTSTSTSTSTTSTTTVAPLPMTTYCYEEIWECGDEIHGPLYGQITYWDEYGVEYNETGFCYTTTPNVLSFSSSAIPQTIGLGTIVCPTSSTTSTTTSTTTTTAAPGIVVSAITLTTSGGTATCTDDNTTANQNYAYIAFDSGWFITQGGFNVVKGSFANPDTQLYNSSSPGITIHPDSTYFGNATILPGGATGTFMIADDSSETPFAILLVSDGDFVTSSPCF